MHRTVYNYHPVKIGHCSPARECYTNSGSSFSEIDSASYQLTQTNSDGQVRSSKVGCLFPIVVVCILPEAEFGRNDHREDAPHFSNNLAPFVSMN